MKRILSVILTAVIALTLSVAVNSQQNKKKETHPVTVDVIKINNNNSDGVTRITVRLTSLPNTASRVDSVSLYTCDGRKFSALDIDGIDFKRYFQWEETGQINVDVDFPRQNRLGCSRLVFHTVYGDFTGKVSGGCRK